MAKPGQPTIHRIPSWKGSRGSIFYGDSSLPAPLLEECFVVFTKYSINKKKAIDNNDKVDHGIITKDKLPKAFMDLGIFHSDAELAKILNLASEKVDLGDFCRMIRSIRETFIYTTHSENSIRLQNILDAWSCLGGKKDKTGKIEASKMKLLLSTLGLQFDVEGQLKQLDIDQDGKVDFYEFQQLFKEI